MGSLSYQESMRRTLMRLRDIEKVREVVMKKKGNGKLGNGHASNGQFIERFDKSPERLLTLARLERGKSDQWSASEYAGVVHILRQKQFTWSQIVKWLNQHGVKISGPTIFYAYKKSVARGDIHLDAPKSKVMAQRLAH